MTTTQESTTNDDARDQRPVKAVLLVIVSSRLSMTAPAKCTPHARTHARTHTGSGVHPPTLSLLRRIGLVRSWQPKHNAFNVDAKLIWYHSDSLKEGVVIGVRVARSSLAVRACRVGSGGHTQTSATINQSISMTKQTDKRRRKVHHSM